MAVRGHRRDKRMQTMDHVESVTDAELAALEKLYNETHQSKWTAYPDDQTGGTFIDTGGYFSANDEPWRLIAEFGPCLSPHPSDNSQPSEPGHGRLVMADAEFSAMAHAMAPRLIETIRSLREERATLIRALRMVEKQG